MWCDDREPCVSSDWLTYFNGLLLCCCTCQLAYPLTMWSKVYFWSSVVCRLLFYFLSAKQRNENCNENEINIWLSIWIFVVLLRRYFVVYCGYNALAVWYGMAGICIWLEKVFLCCFAIYVFGGLIEHWLLLSKQCWLLDWSFLVFIWINMMFIHKGKFSAFIGQLILLWL